MFIRGTNSTRKIVKMTSKERFPEKLTKNFVSLKSDNKSNEKAKKIGHGYWGYLPPPLLKKG